MRRIAIAGFIAFVSCAAFGQPTTRPAFEVASIKMYSAESSAPSDRGSEMQFSPEGITIRYMKLVTLIQWAYDIREVVNGPDWVNSQR